MILERTMIRIEWASKKEVRARVLVATILLLAAALAAGCSTRPMRIETAGELKDTTTIKSIAADGTTTSVSTEREMTPAMAEFLLKKTKLDNERWAINNCLQFGCNGLYVGGVSYGAFTGARVTSCGEGGCNMYINTGGVTYGNQSCLRGASAPGFRCGGDEEE